MKASASSFVSDKNSNASRVLFDIAVFTVFYAIFFCLFKYVLWSDIPTHMEIIIGQLKNGHHFAFYMALPRYCFQLLSAITSYFNGQLGDQTGCMVLMLSLIVFLKYYFTRRMLQYFITGFSELNCRVYAFSLAFVAPVALGFHESNVHRCNGTLQTSCWHNITIIFCVTFSLALFWYTVRWFRDGYKNRDFIWVCIFLVLSILSKPSYMFAFIPTYCILVLLYLPRERSKLLLSLIPIILVLGAYLFMVQQLGQFKVVAFGKEVNPYGRGIYWAPFEYYLHYLKDGMSIFRLHFSSIMFPIFTGLYLGILYLKKRSPISIIFTATLLQFLFGLTSAYFFNIGEGYDRFHGNMIWQIMACNYILFTMCVIAVLRKPVSTWHTMLLTVYGMHFLSGIIFLLEIFRSKAGWADPLTGWWTKAS